MDFLPTKGFEYLLAIGYLLLLIPFWMAVFRGRPERLATAPAVSPALAMRSWFRLPEDVYFHRGHTWAAPEPGGVFRVGIDEFAERMLGSARGVDLPAVGETVEQGRPGPTLRVDGHAFPLLSPVEGEVLEVNGAAVADPTVIARDPYGAGWLMRVRASRPRAVTANLLPGRLARGFMDDAAERLSAMMGPALGPVLQDGGVPVPGFAREIAPGNWVRVASELLLTEARAV